MVVLWGFALFWNKSRLASVHSSASSPKSQDLSDLRVDISRV